MDSLQKDFSEKLKTITTDPLLSILLSQSHLTEKQLQAILIDLFFSKNSQKRISSSEKAQIMPKKLKRGAYNRILNQGRRNIIRAFFTIYLLGYLEILDLEDLEAHITLGKGIKAYIETYREALARGFSSEEAKRLQMVYKELIEKVKYLAKPISLKGSSGSQNM